MLNEYRQHVAERAALGIPPLALDAKQTAELIELIKNPPAGEEEFLMDLLTYRVPPGVDDAAKVISRMCDIIMMRTFEQDIIERFAAASRVPVINGLTNEYHPCQILADIFTYMEHRGSIQGKTVAWVGDANNMSYTWVQAARLLDFQVHISTPPGYALDDARISDAERKHLRYFEDPREACAGADLVTTDVWTSMGYEAENEARRAAFANFCVDAPMMASAHPDALFMHCLPAHRGEEVTAEVIDGPQSVVWDEAENRLHVQKALLEYLVIGRVPT